MQNKNIKFENGLILYNHLQWILHPINMRLCIIHEIIKNETEKTSKKLLINSSNKDAQIIYNQIKNLKSNKTNLINKYLETINSIGIGKTQIKFIGKDTIIFSLSSHLSTIYKTNYKTNPKTIPELVIVGYLKNFLEITYQKKIKYEIINQKIIIIKFTITNKNTTPQEKTELNLKQKKSTPSPILQKILIYNHLKTEEGKLLLWNTYATLTSYTYLIELTKNLNSKYEKFFANLGAMQAKSAVELQKNIFGIQKEKMFKQIIEQTELIGIGSTKHELTEKGLKFTLQNNLEQYKKTYKEEELKFVNIYFKNLIKGTYEFSFEKTTKLKETKNNNNNQCTLTITKNSRKLSNQEISINKYINSKNIIVKTSSQ